MVITWPATATLTGTIVDEGWYGPITYLWEQVAGPDTALFDTGSPVTNETVVTFPETAGAYIFRLTASNDVASGTGLFFVYVFAGEPAAPTFESELSILVNGVEQVGTSEDWDKALNGSLTITENPGSTPNQAAFLLLGPPPLEGQSVIVTLGATRIFGGIVLRDSHGFIADKLELDQARVNAIDWTWMLTRRLVTKRYAFQSVSEIARNLMLSVPGFTSTQVQDGLPTLEEFVVTGITVAAALTQLAERVPGSTWKVDYFKDLYFGTVNPALEHPRPITETDWVVLLEGFQIDTDLGPTVNRVQVTGGGSAVTRDGGDTWVDTDLLFVNDTDVFSEGGGVALVAGARFVVYSAKDVFQSIATAGGVEIPALRESVNDAAGALVAGDTHVFVQTLVTQFGETLATTTFLVTIGGGDNAIHLAQVGNFASGNVRPADIFPRYLSTNFYMSAANTATPLYQVGTIDASGVGELLITADVTGGKEPPTVDTGSGPLCPVLIVDPSDAEVAVQGESVNLWVQVNDTASQTDLAARFGGTDDGVIEDPINDGRITSKDEALQRGLDRLAARSAVTTGVRYRTHDQRTHPGAVIVVALGTPYNVTAEFTIQQVTISTFDTIPGRGSWPIYTATADVAHMTFEDVLRRGLTGAKLAESLTTQRR